LQASCKVPICLPVPDQRQRSLHGSSLVVALRVE
jgi:hypothetical protein